jgi:hypothetical protein
MPAPPLVGSFDETPVEQVVAYLFRAERTGRLTAAFGDDVRAAYFKTGLPVFANSNAPDETFGRMLVDEGKLTAPQLNRAERMAKERQITLGKQLVESGMIEPDELTAALLREAELRFGAMLRMEAGDYDYADDATWLAKIKRPEMELFDLVYQAVLARVPPAALARRYEPRADGIALKNEARLPLVGRFQWREEHLDAFMHIDGERTVRRVIEESGQPVAVVHELLYVLELFDLIRFR